MIKINTKKIFLEVYLKNTYNLIYIVVNDDCKVCGRGLTDHKT